MRHEPLIILTEPQLAALIQRTASAVADDLRSDIESRSVRELMTKAEAADYLRCDISKINRNMKDGMPYEQFGGHPRFRKSSIDLWLSTNERFQKIPGKANHRQRQELA